MQIPGTEAIRTQIQPSKPNQEITKITNCQNTKRTYSQPNEQLFPKRWPLSYPNRPKNNMNTRKVKRHRNSDTKNRQQRTTTMKRDEDQKKSFYMHCDDSVLIVQNQGPSIGIVHMSFIKSILQVIVKQSVGIGR